MARAVALRAQPPAIFILGPTASGKSGVALELARRFGGEIVSVDSAQVYREMDIGTAKPDAAVQAAVRHHLIDLIAPTDAYSAARFRADALHSIADIVARGALPILAGGTMLYFRALTEGLSVLPAADGATRAALEAEALARGWPAMHAELGRVDPQTAARLAPADSQRIQRALEVYRITGEPMSRLTGARERSDLPYRILKIGLAPHDRGVLHARIATRFGAMLDAGLVAEVRGLRARHGAALHANLPSMRCVGYRQAWEYLDGAFDAQELCARAIASTRQLAKRQLTWLRAMHDVEMLDCLREDLAAAAVERTAAFLAEDVRPGGT